MKLWQRTNSITHANPMVFNTRCRQLQICQQQWGFLLQSFSHVPGRLSENKESVMECGTHFVRYFCSQHPGAACWRAEGLLLATRHQSFINQPQDLFLTTFLTFTQYFSFFITPRKNKNKGSPVSRPSFRKTELDLWKCFYAVIFDLVQNYNQQITKCICRLGSL